MGNKDFDGNTWVAFLDIGGFAALVVKSRQRAYQKLSEFYRIGYEAVSKKDYCQGLIVSDSAIFWSNRLTDRAELQLDDLLPVIKKIYLDCLEKNILLIGALAYGDFKYEKTLNI